MKRLYIFIILVCSGLSVSAQDFGISIFSDNRFPIGGQFENSPWKSLGGEIAWSNPDKGFPVFGYLSMGYVYGIPMKLETVNYTTASGSHKADIMAKSIGYRIRYMWEIKEVIPHLAILGGLGSSSYRIKLKAKTDSPLLSGEYFTDSRGIGYNYTDSGYSRNAFGLTSEFIAMGMYEFPRFNVWAQLAYSMGVFSYELPYTKGLMFNAGVFLPLIRK